VATLFSVTGCLVRNPKSVLVFFLFLHTELLGGQSNLRLGTSSLVFGPGSGTGSVVIAATARWTAATATPWLHIDPARTTGGGNALFTFTYDSNSGSTRTGSILFNGGQASVSVTQAGASYSPTTEVTTLVSSVLGPPALDGYGNVYFADVYAGAIRKWHAATSQVTTPVSVGLKHPHGVAVDRAGNIYIADTDHNAIKEWVTATGQLVILVPFLNQPLAIALDPEGDVYIADTGNNAIEKWTAATGQLTTVVASLNQPSGIAIDGYGNVYFSDTGNEAIKEWVAATGQIMKVISSGLNRPTSLGVDGAGNLYFIDNQLYKWTAGTGQVSQIAGCWFGYCASGLTVDGAGNLYTTWWNGYGCCFQGNAVSRGTDGLNPLYAGPSFLSGLALDTSGNLYFASTTASIATGTIQEWNAQTAQLSTVVASGSDTPFSGVTVDSASNVYTADWNGDIIKWTPATTQQMVLANIPTVGKYTPPAGMAVDPTGDLFFTDNGKSIQEWIPGTGQVTTAVQTVSSPEALAIDAAGNLYFNTGAIDEWTPATGGVTTLISSGTVPRGAALDAGLAVDGAGDVYFSYAGGIQKRAAATGEISTLATVVLNFGGAFSKDAVLGASSLAVDQLRNVYAISYGDVKKITSAFIETMPIVLEPLAGGSDQLPTVLPVSTPLDAVSDQPWLTITSQQNGVVKFSFTPAPAQRTAHISVLGQSIPVTQANTQVPAVASYSVLWGSKVYTLGDSNRNRLPWQITGIRVVFSEVIATGNAASLMGVSATDLSGLGTNILTWTIRPISSGSYVLSLADSGANALRDFAGNSVTGDSKPTIKVLWGDVNDDGVVNAADLSLTMSQNRYSSYNIFADLNGDGVVNVNDVQIARTQVGHILP